MTLLEAWKQSSVNTAYYYYHNVVILVTCESEMLEVFVEDQGRKEYTAEEFCLLLYTLHIPYDQDWYAVR